LRFSAETWGSAQRDNYRAALDQALTTLGRSPHIGRVRDEISHGLRSYRVEQHIIFYRVAADTVTILRILHQKMDVDQHLEGP
jgi:toxin ParE1/3/4